MRDLDSSGSRQTIALAMIVRNEEAVIDRCLASVAPLVDAWVICDTGSTDRTPEIVRLTLSAVPGELHQTQWVDFGHNRSELMKLARGAADYLLLVDADMTVVQRAPLRELTADAYHLRQTGPLDYAVIRLVRGDRAWWYEGATHEHIATSGRFEEEQLDELLIEHHGDGSSHTEKYLRDVALLKRDLARDPNARRPLFYLAQTFRDLGRPDLAVEYYRRRVELGGWDEEVFYANFQEGVLRMQLDFASGVPVLLEAWERRPTRAEPLYELARAYRLRGDVALAHMFASRGLRVDYPDDVLFVHRAVYEWGLRIERALAAAALGRAEEARADLLALLREANLPRPTERLVARTLAELGEKVPAGARQGTPGEHSRLATLAPSTRIGEVELDVRPAWPSFNPSIAADGDGFRMIVRTANYEIERGVLHADGVLLNINYLVALDADLGVRRVEPIVDRSSGPKRYPSRVQGYEDCRLVEVGGRWYATATACDLNRVERREIALLSLDGAEITGVAGLPGPHPGRHEKNWMPFVVDGVLHVVYSCGPTTVFRCDVRTGELAMVSERPAPELARDFRGGSQGLPLESGGHLFVVHEVDRSARSAQYLHRFVHVDETYVPAAISPAFTFADQHVEFCAGIARAGDEVVLSFGVSDVAAGLAVLSLEEALGLLEPCAADASPTVADAQLT
jgi:glycosyltransferase involved in cell wall biosynthesis